MTLHEGRGAGAETTPACEESLRSITLKRSGTGPVRPYMASGVLIVEYQRCHFRLEGSGTAWLALWIARFWARPVRTPPRIAGGGLGLARVGVLQSVGLVGQACGYQRAAGHLVLSNSGGAPRCHAPSFHVAYRLGSLSIEAVKGHLHAPLGRYMVCDAPRTVVPVGTQQQSVGAAPYYWCGHTRCPARLERPPSCT